FKSRKRWRRYQCCRTSGRARTADGGGEPPHATWSSADGAQVAEHVHRARCIVPLRRQRRQSEDWRSQKKATGTFGDRVLPPREVGASEVDVSRHSKISIWRVPDEN